MISDVKERSSSSVLWYLFCTSGGHLVEGTLARGYGMGVRW